MENQPQAGRNSRRFGSRGEHLVVLQALLMGSFAVLPPWPEHPSGSGLAIAIMPVLAGLCWLASAYFGLGGSMAIRRYLTPLPYPVEGNRLVETGAYRLVRHPLYTAIMLAFTGWALFTASILHAGLTALAYAFFSHKASKEEAWLTQIHPEYPDYAARTGRFLPRLRGRSRR